MIVTEGKEMICGVRVADVFGESHRAKVTSLYGMKWEQYSELLDKCGFRVTLTHEKPVLLCIPPGYIIGTFTIERCTSLQWAIAPPSTMYNTVHAGQRLLMASHGELNTLPMQALHALLESEMEVNE